MYEHLVRDVRRSGESRASGWDYHHFWFTVADRNVSPQEVQFSLTSEQLGAVETWLKQPKPETAEERAGRLAHRIRKQFGLHNEDDESEVAELIAAEIRAAEEAARGQGS